MEIKYHKKERDSVIQQLADKFRKECPKDENITEYVINKIYEYPAPKFYISVYNAKRHVNLIHKNKKLSIKNKLKIQMYKDIHKIATNIQKTTSKHFGKCIIEALDKPANSFYISKYSIQNIIYGTTLTIRKIKNESKNTK